MWGSRTSRGGPMSFSPRAATALELVLRDFDSIGMTAAAAKKRRKFTGNQARAQNRAIIRRSYGVLRAFESKLVARRIDQVLHQRHDGHRAGPSRIQRYPSRYFFDPLEVHIAGEASRPHPPKAYIYYACSGLNHVRGDEPRPPHVRSDARHQDVGFAADRGKVARMAMTPGDGRIAQPAPKNQRRGLARDVASPDDHGAGAIHRYPVFVEQRENSAGRAGDEPSPLTPIKAAHARCSNRVHVFKRIDRVEEPKPMDAFGQGELDQDAGDARIAIELADHVEHHLGGALLLLHRDGLAAEPEIQRHFLLVTHVLARCRVLADQDGRERRNASMAIPQFPGVRAHFRQKFLPQRPPIHDYRSHRVSLEYSTLDCGASDCG